VTCTPNIQRQPRTHDRGNHSGLCASSRIGALPSRIPRPVNVTACLMTDILSPSTPRPPKSPGSRSIVVETAATSGSSGTTRGGSGGPSSNAVTGCKFPKRRIQRSVALNETRTCHEPPSCAHPPPTTVRERINGHSTTGVSVYEIYIYNRRTVTVLQSAAAMPNARRYPAA
jgi:hypothetical protein